jgi:hypothetical protein
MAAPGTASPIGRLPPADPGSAMMTAPTAEAGYHSAISYKKYLRNNQKYARFRRQHGLICAKSA